MSIAPFMWIPASLVGKGGGDNVDADKCRWRGGCAACDESECDNRDKSASDTEVEALRRRVAELEGCEHLLKAIALCAVRSDARYGWFIPDTTWHSIPGMSASPPDEIRKRLPAPQPAAEVCRWHQRAVGRWVADCGPSIYETIGAGIEGTICPGCGRRVEVVDPAPQPAAEVCRWRRDEAGDWRTDCGGKIGRRGGVLAVCPGCGRRVEVAG